MKTFGVLSLVAFLVVLVVPCQAQGQDIPWIAWPEESTGPGNAYWYTGEQGDVTTRAVVKVRRALIHDKWIGSFMPGFHAVGINGDPYQLKVTVDIQGNLSVHYKPIPEEYIGAAAMISTGTYSPNSGDVFAGQYFSWTDEPLWSWRVERSSLVVSSRGYPDFKLQIPPSEPIVAELVGAGRCLWVEASWMHGAGLRVEVLPCGGP